MRISIRGWGQGPGKTQLTGAADLGLRGLGFGELICNHPHPLLLKVPHAMILNPKYSVTSYLARRVIEGVYEGYLLIAVVVATLLFVINYEL